MKPIAILFLVSLSGMIFNDNYIADAASIKSTNDVTNSRSYQKIASLLSTIERDVKRDLSTMNSQIKRDDNTAASYKRTIASYTNTMKSFKTHMNNAQAAYKKYDAEFNNKVSEDAQLLKSLNIQRTFIREERKYIDHMEAESLRLKKYSPQYAAIQLEIRQMRVQVNKEIQDVENAYNRAKAKVGSQKNSASSQRSRQLSLRNSYSSSVAKYESLTRTYQSLLDKISVQKTGNLRLKKELQDQIDLLQEIRVVLATFKPTSSATNKYQAQYESCVQDFRAFRNKYQNMNCTAL